MQISIEQEAAAKQDVEIEDEDFGQAVIQNSLNKHCERKLLEATKHNAVKFLTGVTSLGSVGWGGRASLPINMMGED